MTIADKALEAIVTELFRVVTRLIENKLTTPGDRAAAWDRLALRAANQAKLDARRAKR